MRKNIFCSLIAIAIMLSPAASFSASLDMVDGEWETSFDTQIEGMPFAMPGMSFKIRQCLTKEKAVPKTKEKDENCKIKDMNISGNTVRWVVECSDKDASTLAEGEITYSGTSYKGTMKNTITDKKGTVTRMTTKLSGKRLGECKAAEKN